MHEKICKHSDYSNSLVKSSKVLEEFRCKKYMYFPKFLKQQFVSRICPHFISHVVGCRYFCAAVVADSSGTGLGPIREHLLRAICCWCVEHHRCSLRGGYRRGLAMHDWSMPEPGAHETALGLGVRAGVSDGIAHGVVSVISRGRCTWRRCRIVSHRATDKCDWFSTSGTRADSIAKILSWC